MGLGVLSGEVFDKCLFGGFWRFDGFDMPATLTLFFVLQSTLSGTLVTYEGRHATCEGLSQ